MFITWQVLSRIICIRPLISSSKQYCYKSHLPRLRVTELGCAKSRFQSGKQRLRAEMLITASDCPLVWSKHVTCLSAHFSGQNGPAGRLYQRPLFPSEALTGSSEHQSPRHTWSHPACLPSGLMTTSPRSRHEPLSSRGTKGRTHALVRRDSTQTA